MPAHNKRQNSQLLTRMSKTAHCRETRRGGSVGVRDRREGCQMTLSEAAMSNIDQVREQK
jgi:hypothetical protein